MNVLVTGAGGYIGSLLVEKLVSNPKIKKIIAIDIKPLNFTSAKIHSYLEDICDPGIYEILKKEKVQVVIHLAAIVNPQRELSRKTIYSMEVEGTENLVKCCIKSNVSRFIYTSSGAAYGYHPDNPIPLKETNLLRGNQEFIYSYHKMLIEKKLNQYKKKYPKLKQFIFRVSTVLGERTQNQITKIFQNRFLIAIKGSLSPFCFVWDEDVVNCLIQSIFIPSAKADIYNLTGDGYLTIEDIGHLLRKKIIYFSPAVLKTLITILRKLKLTDYTPEQIIFLQYRPVLDNTKLKKKFGFIPEKNSRETFLYYISKNGL